MKYDTCICGAVVKFIKRQNTKLNLVHQVHDFPTLACDKSTFRYFVVCEEESERPRAQVIDKNRKKRDINVTDSSTVEGD